MIGKEALERLEKHFHLSCYSFDNNENSDIREYNIIKQDLDKLEELKKVNEILINKSISKMFLQITKDVDGYNKAIKEFTYFPTLTQEEYDLLRRHFKNE